MVECLVLGESCMAMLSLGMEDVCWCLQHDVEVCLCCC